MKTSKATVSRGLELSLLFSLVWVASVEAQSTTSFELWDTCSDSSQSCATTNRTILRVDKDGGFVAFGDLGIGAIPASGAGLRTMWYPFKGAFRTGNAGSDGTTNWNDANVGFYSFAAGTETVASAFGSFAFGDRTVVTSVLGAGFGSANTVSGTVGFAAGASNFCSGFACVALGFTNRATAQGAVAIGYRTIAASDYAVSLGHRATSCSTTSFSSLGPDGGCPDGSRIGTFSFADASTTAYLGASAQNQFNSRAAGGYRLFTNASLTAGVTLNAGGSAWNVVSDRDAKEQFADYDGEALLERITLLPIQTWRYIGEEDQRVRHIGPTAQDWQALIAGPLDLNDETRTINQGDYDGVNLAAIKALAERTQRLDVENAELRAQLAALSAERLAVREELAQLRVMLAELASERVSSAIAAQP